MVTLVNSALKNGVKSRYYAVLTLAAWRRHLVLRFTRAQVTPRSSALNAFVEDAKCSNWHTHGPQSLQPEVDVKASKRSETAVNTAKQHLYLRENRKLK